LIALAYILTEIFRQPGQTGTSPAEITLDPSRYQDPAAPGAETASTGANISNTPAALDSSDSALDDYYTTPSPVSPSYGGQGTAPAPPSGASSESVASALPPSSSLPAEPSSASSGRYLVIAGSFRQLAGAEAMVRSLKKGGFAEASVGKTNRGAFAVALVGSSESYEVAQSLAAELKQKGFEALIKIRE
ncbi:MAG: SPOR domain-containing protein, partial [Lewinella sp.]|nr:SPOR domain-containing protein [Lewinella sp.]